MKRSQLEKISKALGDETRLRIYEAISATDHMNCGEIVSMRGVTPATVSHHLKILSEAGLIACRRQGQFVHSHTVPDTSQLTRGRSRKSRAARRQRGVADSRKSAGPALKQREPAATRERIKQRT